MLPSTASLAPKSGQLVDENMTHGVSLCGYRDIRETVRYIASLELILSDPGEGGVRANGP